MHLQVISKLYWINICDIVSLVDICLQVSTNELQPFISFPRSLVCCHSIGNFHPTITLTKRLAFVLAKSIFTRLFANTSLLLIKSAETFGKPAAKRDAGRKHKAYAKTRNPLTISYLQIFYSLVAGSLCEDFCVGNV